MGWDDLLWASLGFDFEPNKLEVAYQTWRSKEKCVGIMLALALATSFSVFGYLHVNKAGPSGIGALYSHLYMIFHVFLGS